MPRLTDAGYRVEVICPQGTKQDTEPFAEIGGVRIHRYRSPRRPGGPAGYVREYSAALWHTLRIARRLSRQEPFDVVQACNPPDLLFLIALALRPHRGALSCSTTTTWCPELFESALRPGRRPGADGGSALLERLTFGPPTTSSPPTSSYREVADPGRPASPTGCTVVRSAPDPAQFVPVAPDPALKHGRAHLACYLGVMGHQDGVDYALRALAHLHGPRPRRPARPSSAAATPSTA